ncbi:MAG TPA: hypothetical protein VI911_04955 [Patescibacteria group bacterium]|nr:hypothetical protein [Patescibacteria group bacterium]
MSNIICNLCGKATKQNKIRSLHLFDNDKSGVGGGDYIYCCEICLECQKKILKLMCKKVDINKNYIKEFKQ